MEEKDEKRFVVVATDGKLAKEIMWIRRASHGLFVRVITPESKRSHISYHKDGTIHNKMFTREGKPIEVWHTKDQPLDEFKGIRQLFMGSASSSFVMENSIRDYDFGEYDEVIFIDMRTCRDRQLNMSFHLVEPNRLDLLKPEFFGERTHIHVLTSVKPWLTIITI